MGVSKNAWLQKQRMYYARVAKLVEQGHSADDASVLAKQIAKDVAAKRKGVDSGTK